MSTGKGIIIHLILRSVKNTLYIFNKTSCKQCVKMSKYFPKSFRSFGRNINVKVDLPNYATKTDIKNISHVDTLSFGLRTNLANLKMK